LRSAKKGTDLFSGGAMVGVFGLHRWQKISLSPFLARLAGYNPAKFAAL
jgi:hypothetical protein